MTWLDDRAAPGRLETVRAFVNTLDLARGPERLQRPADARDWLVSQGLAIPGLRLGRSGLARTLGLREAIRSLLLANGGAPEVPSARIALNDVAARAGLRPQLAAENGGTELIVTTHGLDAALGALVSVVFAAVTAGNWTRLRACPTCQWAFYDTSRNRSSRWCDMAICGNRAKQRAYNHRLRLESSAKESRLEDRRV
jgi:predicted RNA-binding Zn ribbon-like protein